MSKGSRQTKIIDEVFEDVRRKDIASAFRGCQRLSLLSGDLQSFAYFVHEQEHGDQEALRHLLSSLGELTKEQIKVLHEIAVNRKMRNRTFSKQTCKMLEIGEDTLFWAGCGQIDFELEASQDTLDSLKVPSNVNDIDAAFFYKENELIKLKEIHRRSAIKQVKERLLSAAFDYASLIEQKVEWEANDSVTIAEIENSVFSFLERLSPASLNQLQKASSLLNTEGIEEKSQAALLIRRCINTIADAIQKPVPGINGLEQDKPLNRISYFLETEAKNKGAKLISFSSKELEKLLRTISDRSNKGVHGEISKFELQQTYLATLLYLGNIAKFYQEEAISE
ncbi:hypothetical protein PHIN109289_15485 [Phaeobacter inhibens]|uniref:hypothetical protein n=1 Tax=Phaeobacter inhibens TaxID=221822 RepID=UPI000420AECD|nr:hypothetical protein [Phaeobacter inhibens]